MKLGASRFMVKPMELGNFVQMVSDVIGECREMKLPVPDRPLAGRQELDRLQMDALSRKLDQKVRELAVERRAHRRSEEEYQQLKSTLKQLIRQAVEEERKKDDLVILQGRQAVMVEMINNIAHQWRQPLNTLGLLAQDLQMTYRVGDISREFVDANVKRTMEVIRGMSKTIDDFRTFFKPEPEKVEFKVLKVIAKMRSFLEGSFKQGRIGMEIQTSGDPVVLGYPGQLSQALLNIMINARDAFSDRQVDQPRVTLRLSTQDDRAIIIVADNAGGIAPELLDRIFDPYFTTKGPDKGTGIGLFMAKVMIEKNMGGNLSVRNLEDGAEFRIEL
jgi:C4-dicarboxylate-specific signal transduction histidine kinase